MRKKNLLNNEFGTWWPSKKCKKALHGGSDSFCHFYFLRHYTSNFNEQIEQHLQRAASTNVEEGMAILNETKTKLDTVKSLLVTFSVDYCLFLHVMLSLQSNMDQLVLVEGAAKREIWKQKVKNLSDEYSSLYKSWEKDARRFMPEISMLYCTIWSLLPGRDWKSKRRKTDGPSSLGPEAAMSEMPALSRALSI